MNPFNLSSTHFRASIRLIPWAGLMAAWILLPYSVSLADNAVTPAVEAGIPASKQLIIMAPDGGPAIAGYDPVSYFLDKGPRKGSEDFSHRWQDATWLFVTAEHRELFKQSPAKYAPAYGGYCAAGMAEGYAAESDPLNAWTIHQGKLYLNWDAEVLKEWLPEIASQLIESENAWPEVQRELQASTAEIYWHDNE